MVACIFRIFNLFLHKNIHIPLVASTYVVFATTTATASNNYSAGIIHRVCNKKKYFHIVGLAYIRVMELLLYFDETQNVNVNVNLLISARRLKSTA